MSLPAGTLLFASGPWRFVAPDGTVIPPPTFDYGTVTGLEIRGGFLALTTGAVAGSLMLSSQLDCTASDGATFLPIGAQSFLPAVPDPGHNSAGHGLGTNGRDAFYVLKDYTTPTTQAWTILKLDRFAATVHEWTTALVDPLGFTFPESIAVAPDDTVAYIRYHYNAADDSSARPADTIFRYDLVAGTGPTVWTTEPGCGGELGTPGLLALPNGEVLAVWRTIAAPQPLFLARYSAAGVQLQRYDLVDGGAANFIVAIAVGQAAQSVWVSTFLNATGRVQLVEYRLSDGAVLQSWDKDLSSFSWDSAPMVVIPAIPSPIPPAPPGAIEPIRRLRQAPHLWDGTSGHRLKYPGFQLLVEAGAPRDTDGPMSWVLQWSDDGGHSWSHEHRIEGSRLGEHTFRFWWRRLGQSRDRVFRVVNSDDAKVVIVDALLTPDPVEGSS